MLTNNTLNHIELNNTLNHIELNNTLNHTWVNNTLNNIHINNLQNNKQVNNKRVNNPQVNNTLNKKVYYLLNNKWINNTRNNIQANNPQANNILNNTQVDELALKLKHECQNSETVKAESLRVQHESRSTMHASVSKADEKASTVMAVNDDLREVRHGGGAAYTG